MRSTLIALAVCVSLVGCGGDKGPYAAAPAAKQTADQQPVGSAGATGAVPGSSFAPSSGDNASVIARTKSVRGSDGAGEDIRPARDYEADEPSDAPASADDDYSSSADPEYREITIPAGTLLPLELRSSVGSDTSEVEDAVRATLRRSVTIGGTRVLPAGSTVTGYVTDARRSGRVKGRARIAFRFSRINLPSNAGTGPAGGSQLNIKTSSRVYNAPATKKQDATKIGAGAVGGAIIGGILGGGKGAAKGAAVGGTAGTGVVLATRGKEVRVREGADVSVKLTAPVRVLVRQR